MAVSSIIPCGMTAQCATYKSISAEKIKDTISLPWIDKKGFDVPFEITSSGVSYGDSSYAYSYTSGDYTYFAVGFRCTSGGCTATINRVYELNGTIHVAASVNGPKPGTSSTCVMTYPYVNARIAKTDKPVVFDGAAGNFGSGSYM